MTRTLLFIAAFYLSLSCTLYSQSTFKSSVDAGISLDNYTSLSMNVIELNDGKLIVNTGGVTESAIFMMNPAGKVVWSKDLEDTEFSGILNATGLVKISDGGYLLTTAGSSQRMYKLLKFQEDGTLDWSRYIGRGNERNGSSFETEDGGIILVGQTVVNTFGLTDIFVAKLDSRGLLLWAKNYGTNLYERGYAAFEAENGDILLHTHQGLDITPGLTRISSEGDLIGSTNFNNIQGLGVEGRAMTRLENGDLLLRTSTGPPTYTSVLTRVTEDAEVVWSRIMATTSSRILRTSPSHDGGFVGLGTFYHQANQRLEPMVAKFDEDGNVQWSNVLGELPGEPRYIRELSNNDILVGFEDSVEDSVLIYRLDAEGIICDYNAVSLFFNDYSVEPEEYALMENSGALQGENEASLEDLYYAFQRTCFLTTALNEIQTSSLNVFPNPTTGIVNIKNSAYDFLYSTPVKITNASGIDVSSYVHYTAFDDQLDLSYLPNGIYFIEFFEDGIRYLGKLVKF